jgi:hypothetical protein
MHSLIQIVPILTLSLNYTNVIKILTEPLGQWYLYYSQFIDKEKYS